MAEPVRGTAQEQHNPASGTPVRDDGSGRCLPLNIPHREDPGPRTPVGQDSSTFTVSLRTAATLRVPERLWLMGPHEAEQGSPPKMSTSCSLEPGHELCRVQGGAGYATEPTESQGSLNVGEREEPTGCDRDRGQTHTTPLTWKAARGHEPGHEHLQKVKDKDTDLPREPKKGSQFPRWPP